ncbi:MAG: hypothetical protein GY765_43080 [bacterium]|nr:hypothetical protein [bacterium]
MYCSRPGNVPLSPAPKDKARGGCRAYRVLPGFVLLLVFLVGPLIAERIEIDKIAAVVNERLITLTDIHKAARLYAAFRKKEQTEEQFHLDVLRDLLNYKVVYLEYSDEITLEDEDYMEVQTLIIKNLGAYDKLLKVLGDFDMSWEDFKGFIKDKVMYEKVVRKNLQVSVSVGFKAIEAFYNNQYLPLQLGLQLKPKSLIEMAPVIETQLRKDRTEEEMAGWLKEITTSYRIENKLVEEL